MPPMLRAKKSRVYPRWQRASIDRRKRPRPPLTGAAQRRLKQSLPGQLGWQWLRCDPVWVQGLHW